MAAGTRPRLNQPQAPRLREGHNAVPQRTRTRNWTAALLAFKIHFGDRVPDTAN